MRYHIRMTDEDLEIYLWRMGSRTDLFYLEADRDDALHMLQLTCHPRPEGLHWSLLLSLPY